ncbi:MAG: Ca2+-transporting ATPase, partial [Sediminicola sp.]
YKNNLVGIIIGITITLTGVLLYMDPFTAFFQFESLTNDQLWTSIGIGFISVIWYELVKGIKRGRK